MRGLIHTIVQQRLPDIYLRNRHGNPARRWPYLSLPLPVFWGSKGTRKLTSLVHPENGKFMLEHAQIITFNHETMDFEDIHNLDQCMTYSYVKEIFSGTDPFPKIALHPWFG